jgi:hypothetical protein
VDTVPLSRLPLLKVVVSGEGLLNGANSHIANLCQLGTMLTRLRHLKIRVNVKIVHHWQIEAQLKETLKHDLVRGLAFKLGLRLAARLLG